MRSSGLNSCEPFNPKLLQASRKKVRFSCRGRRRGEEKDSGGRGSSVVSSVRGKHATKREAAARTNNQSHGVLAHTHAHATPVRVDLLASARLDCMTSIFNSCESLLRFHTQKLIVPVGANLRAVLVGFLPLLMLHYSGQATSYTIYATGRRMATGGIPEVLSWAVAGRTKTSPALIV